MISHRDYNREWMRRRRRAERVLRLMQEGKCIYCEMILEKDAPGHNCQLSKIIYYSSYTIHFNSTEN